MHDTAYEIGHFFFDFYVRERALIVDIGAYNVNGSLRDFCPKAARYVGLDVAAGPGVDIVVDPGSPLPFASNSVDVVVSSSVFEHDGFFWQSFLEMVRIAKPEGVLYLSAPSNGKYHCYPVDNWRFYPDCGKALVKWAMKNGHELTMIESFTAERKGDLWNDFVAIFRKSTAPIDVATVKFLSDSVPCTNAWRIGEPKVRFHREATEDMMLIQDLRREAAELRAELASKQASRSVLRRLKRLMSGAE